MPRNGKNTGFGLRLCLAVPGYSPALQGGTGAGHAPNKVSRKHPTPTPSLSSQVHAYIISSLKKEMPNVFGKESKKKELVNNLGEIYQKVEREHQISPGDFPSLRKMQVRLPLGWEWVRLGHWGGGSGGNPGSMGRGLPT